MYLSYSVFYQVFTFSYMLLDIYDVCLIHVKGDIDLSTTYNNVNNRTIIPVVGGSTSVHYLSERSLFPGILVIGTKNGGILYSIILRIRSGTIITSLIIIIQMMIIWMILLTYKILLLTCI